MILDELDVRLSALAYVAAHEQASGGVVTRAQLEAFTYQGEVIKLIDQSRGIRNPRQLSGTLSILSQLNSPYDDVETPDGLMRYAYRDGDIDKGDNRKLRLAAAQGLPLILLKGIAPGLFVPIPAYAVADNPAERYAKSPSTNPSDSSRLLTRPRIRAPTPSGSPSCACTSRSSERKCLLRTTAHAPSAGSSTSTCWMPRTS